MSLSASKASEILTRVQLNPEIGSDNATYVADLIQRAAEGFVRDVRFRRYPELSQGTSIGRAGASTNISGLSSNEIEIAANGSGFEIIELTLAGADTGAKIATELQTQIRAGSADSFDEITVTFAGTQYTITSGRYGEGSSVNVVFSETSKHVAQALNLSPWYGGVESPGSDAKEEADDYVVEVTEILYRKAGLEGIQSGTVPGDISFSMYADELSPNARRILTNMRRIFR